jgi:carboxyl-terminal processing protease
MHRFLTGAACLLAFASAASAGPEPVLPPPSPPVELTPGQRLHLEAEEFARQFSYTLGQVAEQYARPVERHDLFVAAVRGLYEAAREPVPAGLDADLQRATSEPDQLALLTRVREQLGNQEPLRGAGATLAATRALTRVLDPHSVVVTGEDLRRGSGVDAHSGVGLTLADNLGVGPILVKTVLPGSPAQVAGLRPGDEITHVADKALSGLTSGAARLLLDQGTAGEVRPVSFADDPERAEVTVRRGGDKPRKVSLERKAFRAETVLGVRRRDDNSWDYLADRKNRIAHVRIAAVGNGTALELRNVLTALESDSCRGVVLDLRWCPGGYLQESINAAALFLGECKVATVKARSDKEIPHTSTKENKFLDVPVIVLVNGETSGGAELMAAALQDNRRAKVAGQRTVGKGSIQTMVGLSVADAGLKLTTGTFVRASGKNLHRWPESGPRDDWGVRPDIDQRTSPELAKQLKEWWLLQTLRPGPSNEALPLDDPTADPQRLAAVEALLRK